MKKTFFTALLIIAASAAMMAFTYTSISDVNPPQDKTPAVFPADVQKVLENSCFDCHSDASSNVKAKAKMNLTNWADLSDSKKVGKMQAIKDEVSEGKMPPAKYSTNYPDHALTKENKETLIKWITDESAKLMGQ